MTADERMAQRVLETAHDLRTPLAAVASHAEVLIRMTGTRLTQQEQERMAMLLHSIDRMGALIQRALSDALEETTASSFTDVDVDDLVSEVLVTQAENLTCAGADVRLGRLGHVHGDPLQLSRVFQNIIGNAVSYRRPAGPLVVRIRARDCEDERIFTVSDNGMGMPRSACMRVFDPDGGRVVGPDGHGMGLRICRRIIEEHGGRIWMKPTRSGTAVSFALPSPGS